MERNEFKKALLKKASEVSDIKTDSLELAFDVGLALGEFLDAIDAFVKSTTGFSTNKYKVLRMLLVYFPEGVPISKVAEHIGVTRASMTKIIENFEKLSLVERVANPNDKRSSLVSLTPKGMEEVTVSFIKCHSALAEFADKAGTKKMQDAATIITELSQHLNLFIK